MTARATQEQLDLALELLGKAEARAERLRVALQALVSDWPGDSGQPAIRAAVALLGELDGGQDDERPKCAPDAITYCAEACPTCGCCSACCGCAEEPPPAATDGHRAAPPPQDEP